MSAKVPQITRNSAVLFNMIVQATNRENNEALPAILLTKGQYRFPCHVVLIGTMTIWLTPNLELKTIMLCQYNVNITDHY